MAPTLAGFLVFIRSVMGITTAQLPDSSPIIGYAFNIALGIVNTAIAAVPTGDGSSWSIYALAVYNLAGDRLVNFAPDQPGSTFFATLRQALNLSGFAGGVVQAASDEGTSESMQLPDIMKSLTFRDLQTLKTPWGREYMSIAADYGSSVWGLT